MYNSRSASAGTICPGGRAANSGSLQVSRIRWPSLVAGAENHVAVAVLATVDASTVTSKLTAPVLQRRQPNAEQQGQFTDPGIIGAEIIKYVLGLPAIVMRRLPCPLPRRHDSFIRRSAALAPPPALSACVAAPV